MSLTTGPGMKEIKRIGADFYQFNSQKREPNIWKYSKFTPSLLFNYYLHYLSKVYFNLPEAVASWPKVQINWCSNENMTFGQNEKTNLENLLLALFLSIDIYIKSDYDENICSILFLANKWPESRASPVFGWGMAKAACRECQNVWPNERRDETGNDGQIGSPYCINACRRYLFMNYEYLMRKRVRYNIWAWNELLRLRLSYEVI